MSSLANKSWSGYAGISHWFSHDCIAYVLCRLSPQKFRDCFMNWTQAVTEHTGGEIIAVDGKTARGSRDRKNQRNPLHMVSAGL